MWRVDLELVLMLNYHYQLAIHNFCDHLNNNRRKKGPSLFGPLGIVKKRHTLFEWNAQKLSVSTSQLIVLLAFEHSSWSSRRNNNHNNDKKTERNEIEISHVCTNWVWLQRIVWRAAFAHVLHICTNHLDDNNLMCGIFAVWERNGERWKEFGSTIKVNFIYVSIYIFRRWRYPIWVL